MTFASLPDGALFRWDWTGLPPALQRFNGMAVFRKVGERFCDTADERGALMLGAPRARVMRVRKGGA